MLDKKYESNLFAYHLKRLQEQGIVEKQEDYYHLTPEGRKLSAFIEGDTGSKASLPTPTVIIVVREGNKLLCQKRLKEPFFGIWGLPSGKINFGWHPRECAIRDLKEETGLDAKNAELIDVESTKSFDDGALLYHHLMFTYLVTEYEGTLIERTHKAENKFLTLDELSQEKCFPGDWSRRYLGENHNLHISEKERILEKGVLQKMNTTAKERYRKEE